MMFPIERKAFIEYLDPGKVKITTPLRQREFELEVHQIIDLINLKIIPIGKEYDKFYAVVNSYEGSLSLEIFANGRHMIGEIWFVDNNKLFKSKILENDRN